MALFDKIKKQLLDKVDELVPNELLEKADLINSKISEMKSVQPEPKKTVLEKNLEISKDSYLYKKSKKMFPKIDFTSIEGIEKIPSKGFRCSSQLDSIEYILQRQATEFKNIGQMHLAIACLRKSNEIMSKSPSEWSEKDFLRLIEYLKKDGQFDEARKADAELRKSTPKVFNEKVKGAERFKQVLKECRDLDTDFVECSSHENTCGICSKYQGRIYSISGKSKKYPKLPKIVHQYCGFHEGCRHMFFASTEFSTPIFKGDPVKVSNRPFRDERSKEEKRLYDKEKLDKKQQEQDKLEFDLLIEHLPQIAPKSFSGYRRMKNLKSKSYLILIEKALDSGLNVGIELK
ncbi:MAG: phage minor capsid protein [Eubacterium sp.]